MSEVRTTRTEQQNDETLAVCGSNVCIWSVVLPFGTLHRGRSKDSHAPPQAPHNQNGSGTFDRSRGIRIVSAFVYRFGVDLECSKYGKVEGIDLETSWMVSVERVYFSCDGRYGWAELHPVDGGEL